MDEIKISKFLTKAMGEKQIKISKFLTQAMTGRSFEEYPAFTNFFTWQGMGKLREFYDTWDEEKKGRFRYYAHLKQPALNYTGDYVWHKDNTANLMYEFLKEGG